MIGKIQVTVVSNSTIVLFPHSSFFCWLLQPELIYSDVMWNANEIQSDEGTVIMQLIQIIIIITSSVMPFIVQSWNTHYICCYLQKWWQHITERERNRSIEQVYSQPSAQAS